MKYRRILMIMFGMGAFLMTSCRHNSTSRIEYNLNTDWAFFRGDKPQGSLSAYNDSSWIPVALPHIMQLEQKHCGGDRIYDGVGWYRRYFTLPKEYDNKRLALSFEGIMTGSDVFVNGTKVTGHKGGYVGFTTDITDYVKRGGKNNVIAVRVSAEYDSLTPPGKPQDRLDFYYYSGIYRDAKLVVTDRMFITDELEEDITAGGGVFVTYPEVSKDQATVNVRTHIRSLYPESHDGELRIALINPEDGKVVAEDRAGFTLAQSGDTCIEQSIEVRSPRLWHPYTPNLYTLECKLIKDGKEIDSRKEDIGIRSISYSTDNGLSINGQNLYLVGANRHQSFPHIGDAASNSLQERDVIDMKRGGYNAVRAAHYPQDPAFLAACDKYGFLVIECIPGWQYFNEDTVFANRLDKVCRQMIRRDRNHPSVVLWETALNETQYPLDVVERIYRTAHREYPGDQMYTSGDYFSHEETEPFYDVFYKQVGKYPKDGSVMSNYPEDLIAIKPLFTREWGDGVGEKPRVSIRENEYEQWRQCRGRYLQLNGAGYFDWCMLDANPRMGGHFLWSYNDYARGAEDETMYSGTVDVNRWPKSSYYMMQSMRPKDVSQPGLYDGPMVHIASLNSSAERPTAIDIPVFSNCDEVRLFRNGKLVGSKTREEQDADYHWIMTKGGSPCFVFNTGGYEAGELKAEGIVDGKVVAVHKVLTPGRPDHIEVMIPDHGVTPVADGSDMIPVYFKVCDANGTRVDTASADINITVRGEGRLIGDGVRRIGVNPQKTEGGIGYALIRTTKNAGEIKIEASSDGLRGGSATIVTHPFEGRHLPDGRHAAFLGNEEDGVVVKASRKDHYILDRPKVEDLKVTGPEGSELYPLKNITDGDDFSWWISQNVDFPQVITFELPEVTKVNGSRIRFQKDSSLYKHRVEVSADGNNWEKLYDRECTGWDFRPVYVGKEIKFLRIIISEVSEGNAGLAEVTLFRE